MGLHLHYVDSVAPHLNEILTPLIKKHIAFNLEDSFRILVPDSLCASDLEELMLQDERLKGVLIGKSILPFSNFWQELLWENPRVRPIASSALEQKAFRAVLTSQEPKNKLDSHERHRFLWELKRFQRLNLLAHPEGRPPPPHPLFIAFQKMIHENFRFWTREQAMEEAWTFLKSKGSSWLKKISEIYFLGFHFPDNALLDCLKSLSAKHPHLKLYVFLPSPGRLLDGNSFLAPLLQCLESLAEEKIVYRPIPIPPVRVHSYLTSLHESAQINRNLFLLAKKQCVYISDDTPTRQFLERQIRQTLGCFGPNLESVSNPSLGPLKILQEVSEGEDCHNPVSLNELLKKLIPAFQTYREMLAGQENISALRHLESVFQRLAAFRQAEAVFQEIRPWGEWIEELQEEFLQLKTTPPSNLRIHSLLRSLEKGGLKSHQRIYLPQMNEGLFPPSFSNFRYLNAPQDPFFSHEKSLILKQTFYLAKEEIYLSYVDHSLSGKTMTPSLFLEDFHPQPYQAGIEDLTRVHAAKHPYFTENIEREIKRSRNENFDLDSGDLTSQLGEAKIMERIEGRPLSASYIDDYARCPWKFFARWHLRLEEITEEDLEMDPKFRGSLAHHLLENIYRALTNDYFCRKKIPDRKTLSKYLQKYMAELEELKGLDYPQAKLLPQEVLKDEIRRIESRISSILESDYNSWTQAEHSLLPKFLEWRFGKGTSPKVLFSVSNNLSIPFSGAIDRIDVNEEKREFLVMDYKSSGTEILGKALHEKRSFQLFIYLFAVQQVLLKNCKPLGALYWDLKKIKRNQGMAIKSEVSRYTSDTLRGRSFMEADLFDQLNQDLKVHLKKLLSKLLRGDYSLDPSDCQGPKCPYHTICRYENQPD